VTFKTTVVEGKGLKRSRKIAGGVKSRGGEKKGPGTGSGDSEKKKKKTM